MQEKKLQEKVRLAGAKGGTGKLDRGSTMKVIEKAVKSGQVKLVSGILKISCVALVLSSVYTCYWNPLRNLMFFVIHLCGTIAAFSSHSWRAPKTRQ